MVVLLVTGFLIFILHFASQFFIRSISQSWNTQQHEVDSALTGTIQNRFQNLLRAPFSLANKLSQDSLIVKILSIHQPTSSHITKVIDLFAKEDRTSSISLELFDRTGNLIAYHNREVYPDTFRDSAVYSQQRISLLKSTLITYVSVSTPVKKQSGETLGLLLIGVPFESEIPLHNRFLETTGFRKEIQNALGVDLQLDIQGTSNIAYDARYVSFDLPGDDSEPIVKAYFLKTDPATYLQEIKHHFGIAESFLLLFVIVLISIRILKWVRGWKHHAFLRIGVISFSLWTLRFIILYFGISTSLLPNELLNPVYFASPFAFGIARSIGELTISSVFLIFNAIYIAHSISFNGASFSSPPAVKNEKWKAILAAIFILIIPLIIRAYAAVIRSLVFDSSFNFDDVASIFSQPFLWLMIVNIFFITATFLIILYFALHAARHFSRRAFPTQRIHSPFTLSTFLLVLIIFFFRVHDRFYSEWIFITIAILGAIFIAFAQDFPRRNITLSSLFDCGVLTIVTLVAFIPTLHLFMTEKRSEIAATLASEFKQPVDSWSSLLVTQSLAKLESDFLLVDFLRQTAASEEPKYAFRLWAQSPMSYEPNNSSICIYDTAGNLRSLFAIGIPSASAKQEKISEQFRVVDTTFLFNYSSLEFKKAQNIYTGVTSVRNNDGGKIGTAIITLMAGDKVQFLTTRTDILRTTSSTKSLAPEDEFIVSEFVNDTFIGSSHPGHSHRFPIPVRVKEGIARGSAGVWDVLTFNGEMFDTFFTPTGETNSSDVVAVSIPSGEFRFSLYRILRFSLFFFICSLVLFLLSSIQKIKSRTLYRQISFATKLRIAVILVAAIPVIIFWLSSRQFALEQTREMLTRQLANALTSIEANIMDEFTGPVTQETILQTVSNTTCQEIAAITGNELNVYIGAKLIATSKPELYNTALLDPRLNEKAFVEIVHEGKDFIVTSESIGDFSYLVGYKPLRDENGNILAVVSSPTLFEQRTLEKEYVRSTASVFMWSFLVLFLVLGASVVVSNQIAKPVHELTRATKDIALGDLTRKIESHRNDEIGDLIESFNTMTERLAQSRKELAAVERELAWKEMAKQVAHEIRNPLTPMKLAAQHLMQASRDGAKNINTLIEQVTATIIEQVESLARIATEFSHFARMPKRNVESVDVALLLGDTIRMFSHHEHVKFDLVPEINLPAIEADREELSRCCINLIRNAVQAIDDYGTVSIRVTYSDNSMNILIRDTGIGIHPDTLPKIFEPNFSTKTEGMGLGLSIVKKIIDDLNGSIGISSTVGKGTTVSISLPVQSTTPTDQSPLQSRSV